MDKGEPKLAKLETIVDEVSDALDDDNLVKTAKIECEDLRRAFNHLKDAIRAKEAALDAALGQVEGFSSGIESLIDSLKSTGDAVAALEPAAPTPEAVRDNQNRLKELNGKLDNLKPSYESVLKAAEDLKATCSPDDAAAIAEKTGALVRLVESVREQVDDKEKKMAEGLKRSEAFAGLLDELRPWIHERQERLDKAYPVMATPDTVKKQIDVHTVKHIDTIIRFF